MADQTGISWTDATWNPVRGCSRVSEGCRNCYAERVAARFSGPGQPYEGLIRHVRTPASPASRLLDSGREPRWNGVVRLIPEHLADPLRWKKPRRIFVNSMSDLFHEALTNEQIAAVFGVMAAAPQHTFQVLTKRARRMREWLEWVAVVATGLLTIPCSPRLICRGAAGRILDSFGFHPTVGTESQPRQWPLPNVWLGVSVENQDAADERIPELLATPAAVRFLSCEPLIGPVDLTISYAAGRHVVHNMNALRGYGGWTRPREEHAVQWVIAGCESGPGARPCSVEWLRSLRAQCASAGVPYFLKQATNTWTDDTEDQSVVPMGGSKRKPGGVIELPYLDGVQHAAFPEVP